MINFRYFITFLFIPAFLFSYQIKGRVYRSDNREGIAGAIIILKTGTNILLNSLSDSDGSYDLKNLEKGIYSLEIKAAGFYSETRPLYADRDIVINLFLVPNDLSLGEVDVKGQKMEGVVSGNTIDKNMRQKASVSSTSDPLSVITVMPGIETLNNPGSEDTTKFSVRGGNGNENIAMLDEALIKYPYHHYMNDSVFIDDVVNTLSIYKGVVPAEYGQEMSSLLQVNSDDGAPGFHGKVDLGLLNSSISLNGATADQKLSWIGGIRRTQWDLILPLFSQAGNSSIQIPYYLDSHGRILYKTPDDILSFVWLYSGEPSSFSNLSGQGGNNNSSGVMDYYETVLNLDWKHIFNKEFFMEQSIGTTWAYQLQNIQSPNSTNYSENDEFGLRYKLAVDYSPSDLINFKIGTEIQYYPKEYITNYLYASYTNQINGQQEWSNFSQNGYSGELGVYSVFIDNETSIFDSGFYILDGLRLNYADYIGKYSFDPRGTLGYKLTENDKVYISAGYLSEFPTDPGTIEYLDTNANLEIPGCWHYVIGTELNFLGSIDMTLEGYYKEYNYYINYESNAVVSYNSSGQDKHVYGIDFLLEKKPDSFPVYGWISISGFLSSSYRYVGIDPNMPYGTAGGGFGGMGSLTVAGQSAQPPVDQWYNDDASMPYRLDITAIWDINKNWTLTAEFDYQAGSYYTPVTNAEKIGSYYEPLYGTYNSARYPDQQSLNIKAEYRTILFELPFGIYAECYNIYNYRAIAGYSYSADYSSETPIYSALGIYGTCGLWMKW